MRKIRLKYIIYAILILLFAVIIIFVILFQRNIRTAASVRKLEDGLYCRVGQRYYYRLPL